MMARGIMNYTDSLEKSVDDIPSTVFDDARNHWDNRFKEIKKMDGPENPYQLHQELGEIMLANVLIVRDNKSLEKATDEIKDIETRFKDIKCVDSSDWANPSPSFINQLFCMIHLSKIITKGALLRNEFRGSHYKPDFDLTQPKDFDPHEYIEYLEQKQYGDISEDKFPPGHLDYMKRFEENNIKWLKTTVAQFKDNQPDITYDEVDTSLITPRPRKYD
jgi:succinate dehydrogenase / fumarate reductase flavoprotein subunit